ncbi:MEF2-activating motif and SAP domain-containing transcriptional regulator [Lissotriton helveticus]
MTLLASERSMLIRSKFRSVLQLRMQHRRSQEQLNERNLLSPLNKVPPTASEHLINLGQNRTDDFLKFKAQNRPQKVGPAKMHFCNATPADSSELKEKKARLAEDLNEKILHRPGPLELVQKNILPLDSTIKDAMKDQIQIPSSSDAFAFDDDISTSPSSTSSSPRFALSPGLGVNQSPTSTGTVFQLDFPQIFEENQPITVSVAEEDSLVTSGPTSNLPTQTATLLPKAVAKSPEMGKGPRPKKPKDTKPKVKKLKYHQYIPPDQKVDKSPVAMDAAYSRLLQQQQIFLQLQILNQQQQQQTFCVQAVHPLTTSISPDQVISFTGTAHAGASSISLAPAGATTTTTTTATMLTAANSVSSPSPKMELLPANLDDLTVSKLRQQLRKRGLPVSGTKPALLERLKPYQTLCPRPATTPIASASLVTPILKMPTFHAPTVMGTHSPTLCTIQTAASPMFGEMPKSSIEQSSGLLDTCDGLGVCASGPACPSGTEEDVPMMEFDEDQVLQEKQKVIENLTWKLQLEQKQAEDLRVELEMHKRLKNRHKGELLAPSPGFTSVLGPLPSASSADVHTPVSEAQFLYTLSNIKEEPTSIQEASNAAPASDHFMVFCPPACDTIEQDFELPMQITASPPSPVPGTLSLEEELQEAIQKAEMARSESIDDILEEPLGCTGELLPTETIMTETPKIKEEPPEDQFPCSQPQGSPSKRPRNNDYLSAPGPPPSLMEFPISAQYDFLSTQDSLSMVFSPYQIEMPPSPDRQQNRTSQSSYSSSSASSTSKATFDPADWLEALTSGSTSGFGPSSPVGTSIFSTDFFDSPDLSVNRMIDLMVEQWKPDFDVLCV